jgi:putative transposase
MPYMAEPQPHRKTVRHYNEPGHLHFLTFSCYNRLPLLNHDSFRVILARSIDAALKANCYLLSGFVFMPEHVHLLVWPQEREYDMSRLLFSMKKTSSQRIKRHLSAAQSPLAGQLTIRTRPGVNTFRFWE